VDLFVWFVVVDDDDKNYHFLILPSLYFCLKIDLCASTFPWRRLYIYIYICIFQFQEGLSWLWSYDSLIFNFLCNQWLSPLMLWVRIRSWRGVLYTTLYDKVCQWLATGRWFSPGTLVSSTNKTDRHDITEILLKWH
jgi:hypothetical protein